MELPMTSRVLAISNSSRNRAAFTIVELMAVVVIALLLMSILVTVISKSHRSAKVTMARNSLAVIAQALDNYAHDFKGIYPMSRNPNTGMPVPGEHLLAKALIGPGNASEDGFDGPGFRTVPGGAPRTPYLDPGKFKPELINGQWEIRDYFGTPIAYLPRRSPSKLASTPYFGSNFQGLFDAGDIQGLTDATGAVDAAKVAACLEIIQHTGPFILISAGPEQKFWTDSSPSGIKKNDNIYNFER